MQNPRRVTATAERIAAMDVMHAAFEVPEPLLPFRARRLACPRRAAAETWILEDGGRVASSLLRYPLTFGTAEGETVPGYGLGAVSTHPSARGHGFASRLCAAASEAAEREGRPLGLLFSAIGTDLYGRLGYREVPAWAHWCTRLEELAALPARASLAPLDPRRTRPRLAALYAATHAGSLHMARDEEAWERTLVRENMHLWFTDGDPDGAFRAAVRVQLQGGELYLEELLQENPDPAAEEALWAGLAALALELGKKELGSWLPPSPATARWCEDRGRAKTLPMVRGEVAAERTRIGPADYF